MRITLVFALFAASLSARPAAESHAQAPGRSSGFRAMNLSPARSGAGRTAGPRAPTAAGVRLQETSFDPLRPYTDRLPRPEATYASPTPTPAPPVAEPPVQPRRNYFPTAGLGQYRAHSVQVGHHCTPSRGF